MTTFLHYMRPQGKTKLHDQQRSVMEEVRVGLEGKVLAPTGEGEPASAVPVGLCFRFPPISYLCLCADGNFLPRTLCW